MTISYIGADVDCKMPELAVERKCTIVQRDRIPTDIRSLRSFLASVPGRKTMIIEECPMSGWLYRNLHPYVEKFVVCDPRRNKAVYADGDKTDPIIAYWHDLAGVGLIRAATLFAYLNTPWRFKTPKKLWKYCGLGLRRNTTF